MRLGLITTSPLEVRMRRVLAAHPSITSVVEPTDPTGCDLLVSDQAEFDVPTVEIPQEPLKWLATTLSTLVGSPKTLAYTPKGSPLRVGIPAYFPAPLRALWAEEDNGILVAPTDGTLAGVSVKGTITIGVVEDRDFLTAIASVGAALAHISGTDPITAMRRAGLSIAQHSTN